MKASDASRSGPGRKLVERVEALRKARPDRAWRLLERGFVASARAADDAGRGELWRLRGELVEREDAALAEHCRRTALRIATAQQAGLLQARAGVSLARFLAARRRRDEARRALADSAVDRLPDREAPEVGAAGELRQAL